MEGGGPTQVRRGHWGAEEVMKELRLSIERVQSRTGLSWHCVSGKLSSWVRAHAKIWPFPLTWICSDLSLGLWQLMDDWWCCFSSVAVTSGSTPLTPGDPCFLLQFVSVFIPLLKKGFYSLFIRPNKQLLFCVLKFCKFVFIALKTLVFALKITNWRHAWRRKPSAWVCVQLLQWKKKKKTVGVFTKNCHQWKINYLRVGKG